MRTIQGQANHVAHAVASDDSQAVCEASTDTSDAARWYLAHATSMREICWRLGLYRDARLSV
jgi:hypothetical protein